VHGISRCLEVEARAVCSWGCAWRSSLPFWKYRALRGLGSRTFRIDEHQVAYERAIQTAFREVSDALIAHHRTQERRHEQENLVNALGDCKRLAYVRYRGGVDTQLNALDADRDLFQAELALADLRYKSS
jgi:multidrug efflux system outer membrane protein